MGMPKKYIERMKSFLIVALFISAMLLLYFFWENPALPTFRFSQIVSEDTVQTPTVNDVLWPQQVSVNFGTGGSTVIPYDQQNSWQLGLLALRRFAKAEDLTVMTITKEQYLQIMQFRSICFQFQYSMPFGSFCDEYNIMEEQRLNLITSFSLLSYSAGSPDSLFIADEKTGEYYRLVSSKNSASLETLIKAIEQTGYVAYYPIGTFLGTTNQTLMPLAYKTKIASIPCFPEFDRSDEAAIKGFAQKFFGQSFDFVRRIEESNGTLIYMYGYGQKVLTFSQGSVEYKESVDGSGVKQTYFESLKTVLQFVASHGGWELPDNTGISPNLQYSEAIKKDKMDGYRFVFGAKTAGEDVFYDKGSCITVEIINGQITYYKRDLIKVNPDDAAKADGKERETYAPVNMLAQNYKYIVSMLVSEGYTFKQTEGDALFDEVSNMIDQIRTGYVRTAPTEGSGAQELDPAWVVTINDFEIYFDLYDAAPLGYAEIGAK